MATIEETTTVEDFLSTRKGQEMLAELLAKMEEMDVVLGICAGTPSPSSSPSIPTHVASSGEDQERGARASAVVPNSSMSVDPHQTRDQVAMKIDEQLAILISKMDEQAKQSADRHCEVSDRIDTVLTAVDNSTRSTASATDADHGFPSGVTELADPPVSIDGHLGILFDADGGGIDRLSRLPNPLPRDIISRLPIKDVMRTEVLSCRWSTIWRAAPPHVNSGDLASDLMTTASTSPTPSPTSTPSQDATLVSPVGVTKLFIAVHTRCSTLGLYDVITTLMTGTTSSASPLSTSTSTLFVDNTITKHLLATLSISINHRQGNKIRKPPWLLGTEVFSSWSGILQLISGFLLEASPWCWKYVLFGQLQSPWLAPNSTSLYASSICQFSDRTVMVERQCCMISSHIQSFRPLSWPPWVFARVFRTWVLFVSSLSLLCPPDESSSSSKSCMDSSCSLTFDPGIMLLSTSIVRFMRLFDSGKDTLHGPCALLLQASASSTTASDQDVNLDIPTALLTQHVVCLLSALSLCANSQKYMITDPAMAIFLLEKDQPRGILVFLKCREEFFTNVELDMLGSSKCLMPHYVRNSSKINAPTVLFLVLFESPLDQNQLFTKILAAVKSLLLNGWIYLIRYYWSMHQLDLMKDPAIYWHFAVAIHLGDHLVPKSVTRLPWFGIFPRLKDSVAKYCTAHDNHYTEAMTRVQIQISAFSTAVCWKQLQLQLHEVGIFSEFADSIATYWTPHDINYTEAVTRASIQMLCSQLKLIEVKAYLHSVRGTHQSIICQSTISGLEMLSLSINFPMFQ